MIFPWEDSTHWDIMGFAQGHVSKRGPSWDQHLYFLPPIICAPPLRQGRANYSPREDLALNLYLSIKLLEQSHTQTKPSSELQQSWVTMMETLWSTEPQILTGTLQKKKLIDSCCAPTQHLEGHYMALLILRSDSDNASRGGFRRNDLRCYNNLKIYYDRNTLCGVTHL